MKDEKFSAFIDNELDVSDFDEIYGSLNSDEEMKQRWQRYHIISDTMQKHLPVTVDCSLADRVMHQLESEPTIIAPEIISSFSKTEPSKESAPEISAAAISGNSSSGTVVSPVFKQIAGFAVAASVMLVAVFTTQTFNKGPDQVNAPIAKVPAMPDKSQFARVVEPRTNLPPSLQNRLNKYLANHNQYSSTAPGVLPYARIIGYTKIDKPVVNTIQNNK